MSGTHRSGDENGLPGRGDPCDRHAASCNSRGDGERPRQDIFEDLPALGELRSRLEDHFEAAAGEAADVRRLRLGWLRARTRLAFAAAATLLTAGTATAAVTLTRSSAPLAGRVPAAHGGIPEGAGFSEAGKHYKIGFTPTLTGGEAGWSNFVSFSVAGKPATGVALGGPVYPTASRPVLYGAANGMNSGVAHGVGGGGASSRDAKAAHGSAGGGGVSNLRSHDREVDVAYVLTGPAVAAVQVGDRTIRTTSGPSLPAGDRVAVFMRPSGRSPALTLLRKDGTPIPVSAESRHAPRMKVSFWQRRSPGEAARPGTPARPPAGACALRRHGLPALTPEWGHVVAKIEPVREAVGELLLSCVDTVYKLGRWPIDAAILLNASHPGARPGPIPGAKPVRGDPRTVNAPSGAATGLTARRVGNAWLVVSGGRSLAKRLEALHALSIGRLSLPVDAAP